MIHEAYMPVYMGSRFLARDGRDGTGRAEEVQEALADLKMKWNETKSGFSLAMASQPFSHGHDLKSPDPA